MTLRTACCLVFVPIMILGSCNKRNVNERNFDSSISGSSEFIVSPEALSRYKILAINGDNDALRKVVDHYQMGGGLINDESISNSIFWLKIGSKRNLKK